MLTGLEPYYWAEAVRETQEQLQLNPPCEWNRTTGVRKWHTFWKETLVEETCSKAAIWIVTIEIDECKNNHDHIVFLCDRHKNRLNKKFILLFNCPELSTPSPNYRVSRVERL